MVVSVSSMFPFVQLLFYSKLAAQSPPILTLELDLRLGFNLASRLDFRIVECYLLFRDRV